MHSFSKRNEFPTKRAVSENLFLHSPHRQGDWTQVVERGSAGLGISFVSPVETMWFHRFHGNHRKEAKLLLKYFDSDGPFWRVALGRHSERRRKSSIEKNRLLRLKSIQFLRPTFPPTFSDFKSTTLKSFRKNHQLGQSEKSASLGQWRVPRKMSSRIRVRFICPNTPCRHISVWRRLLLLLLLTMVVVVAVVVIVVFNHHRPPKQTKSGVLSFKSRLVCVCVCRFSTIFSYFQLLSLNDRSKLT